MSEFSGIPNKLSMAFLKKSNTAVNHRAYAHAMVESETPGSRIKALRRNRVSGGRRLTATEVADAIGISRGHLSMIESSKDLPGRDTLAAIADYFGVSVDYILHGGDAAPKPPRSRESVEDPDELALLDFWRGLDRDERKLMVKMLSIPTRRR